MERLIKSVILSVSACLGLWPVFGLADSISPLSYGATIVLGQSVTIPVSVSITSTPQSDAMVDVYFLADTTDSMASTIQAVQASASTILSGSATLGDVQFAVGEYKDDPSITNDPYAYRLNSAMTSDTTVIQSGIDQWSASGGGDFPEANLYAVDQLAISAQTGWREGSTRILVWFGDAFGHDPSLGVDLATASDDLVANNIVVEAIDVGTNAFGLDSTGQATSLATATGGDVYMGIDSTTIVSTISDAIKSVIDHYSTVCLDLSGVPNGVTVTSDPCYSGTFDRSTNQTFTFNVTFTGITEGTYNFPIYATVDGGRIATHNDSIVVSTTVPVPPPGGNPGDGGGGNSGGGNQGCAGEDEDYGHHEKHGHHRHHHQRHHHYRHHKHGRHHDGKWGHDEELCCPSSDDDEHEHEHEMERSKHHRADFDRDDEYDDDGRHHEHEGHKGEHHRHHHESECREKSEHEHSDRDHVEHEHKDHDDWRHRFSDGYAGLSGWRHR